MRIQEQIFEKILLRFNKKSEGISAIQQVLSLSKDSVYRRARGQSVLTPEELFELAKHFEISLDKLAFKSRETVSFKFNQFSDDVKTVPSYLIKMIDFLKFTQNIGEASHFYYASNEIPFFYHCLFPRLIKFKMYVWARNIWGIQKFSQNSFEENLFHPEVEELRKEMVELYLSMDSSEIWNMNIIDNTLNQIEYHLSCECLSNEMAINLLNDLAELIGYFELMAERGLKDISRLNPSRTKGKFFLYHNEMIYTNNMFLVTNSKFKNLFTSFAYPNYIHSSDSALIRFSESWMSRLMSKSTLISGTSERSRKWYFSTLRKKIIRIIDKVESKN